MNVLPRVTAMGDKGNNADVPSADIRLQSHQPLIDEIDTEHDSVYFAAESSSTSFTGCLNVCMEDDEVIRYIKLNSVALYDRLWGARPVRWSSEGTPVDAIYAVEDDFLFLDSSGADTRRATHTLNSNMSQNAPANRFEDGPESQIVPSTDFTSDHCGSWSDLTELPEIQVVSTRADVCELDSSSSKRPKIDSIDEYPASIPRSEKELTQDLRLLQLRRYIQALLLSKYDYPT